MHGITPGRLGCFLQLSYRFDIPTLRWCLIALYNYFLFKLPWKFQEAVEGIVVAPTPENRREY